MGFRDYNPGLNRFTTRDMYNGALADMGLGSDPYTGNRYAFTAGNPISRIELDGHIYEECRQTADYTCTVSAGGSISAQITEEHSLEVQIEQYTELAVTSDYDASYGYSLQANSLRDELYRLSSDNAREQEVRWSELGERVWARTPVMEKTNIVLADSWSAVVDMPVEFRWGSYYAGITNTASGVRGIVSGARDLAKSKPGLSGTAKRGKGLWDVLTGPSAILEGVGQVQDSFNGPCEESCTLGGQAHEYVRGVAPDVNGIISWINRELSPYGTPSIPSVPWI